jgi:CRP-like cAMP-binding protein
MLRTETGNLFLDSLSNQSFASLEPGLSRREADRGSIVGRPGGPVDEMIFPIECVISIVVHSTEGVDVEASLVGRDGVFGISALLEDDASPLEGIVQVPDSMWIMRVDAFAQAYRSDELLNRRVGRYLQVMFLSLAQLSACNRLHDINQRCARWLLMAHDRVVGDELLLTQEFLATMLGTRRPVVSLATATLAKAGYIKTRRGIYAIVDRPGLEAAACECYHILNENTLRLMGYDVRVKPLGTQARQRASGTRSEAS